MNILETPREMLASPAEDIVGRYRLVSLLELLEFNAKAFVEAQRQLTLIAGRLLAFDKKSVLADKMFGKKGLMEEITRDPEFFRRLLVQASLPMCAKATSDLIERSKEGSLKSFHIANLQENFERELATRVFLAIDFGSQPYYEQPFADWDACIKRFPDTQDDIEEMNKCFALSRYTAAVFHSLLVVEHGLIALGKRIGVTDPKLGWDATYKQLGRLINDRSLIPANLDFNFLEQTKSRLDSMKLAWRNKVNHAAGKLSVEKTGFGHKSTQEVILACRSFMRLLADELP